ncbi:MAG: hypothetical protein CMH31_04255 [Micavibrio sp.]|nr:hypothetical protein [Micavibrio sp.]|tara:strand:- start:1860 stop:2897 length:1038 start_codon:yes stop_codon:yes gene_type:complete
MQVRFSHSTPVSKIKKGQDTFVSDVDFYNLENEDFAIEDLNPISIKHYNNLDAYPHAFETDQDVLGWSTAMMTESPLGLALLKHFEEQEWHICLSDIGNGSYHLNIDEKLLEIDNFSIDSGSLGRSNLFRNAVLVNLAHALRDIWHETRQNDSKNSGEDDILSTYKPDSALLLERVRAADCDAMAVMIAWELRGAGYKEVWRHVLSIDQSDMAQILLNIIDYNPTAVYNGMAMAHLFRQWYADPTRVQAVDHDTLEEMDVLVEQGIALGSRTPLPEVLKEMAMLPDGICYLEDVTETVMRDPFFCDLTDPINEAHLFQIVYDNKVTFKEGVPFRDESLARKIFPQ